MHLRDYDFNDATFLFYTKTKSLYTYNIVHVRSENQEISILCTNRQLEN